MAAGIRNVVYLTIYLHNALSAIVLGVLLLSVKQSLCHNDEIQLLFLINQFIWYSFNSKSNK